MTPQEAVEIMKIAISEVEWNYPMNYAVAIQAAIEALEKQIPKNPIGKTDPTFGDVCIVCPNCENRGLANPFAKSRVYDYCPKCGQALDWSEEE